MAPPADERFKDAGRHESLDLILFQVCVCTITAMRKYSGSQLARESRRELRRRRLQVVLYLGLAVLAAATVVVVVFALQH
jgi:hypothetical protein